MIWPGFQGFLVLFRGADHEISYREVKILALDEKGKRVRIAPASDESEIYRGFFGIAKTYRGVYSIPRGEPIVARK